MVCFSRHSLRTAVCGIITALPHATALVLGTAFLLEGDTSSAQCCGQSIPAPVATQTYRLDYQTVYDEQQVTA